MKIQKVVNTTKCIHCEKVMETDETRKAEEGEGIEIVRHIYWDICEDCLQK